MGYLKENLKRIIGKRYGVTCDDFFHANRWNIRIGIPNWGRDYLSVLWEVEFDSKEKAENLVNSLGSIYDLRNTIENVPGSWVSPRPHDFPLLIISKANPLTIAHCFYKEKLPDILPEGINLKEWMSLNLQS